MPKIKYITDIHLDMGRIPMHIEPEPDTILLVAGDTCEINTLKTAGYMQDLERICAAYKEVYAICGNHEFYGGYIDTGVNLYRKLTKHIPNFRVLDNETVDLGDYLLVATTLWTDFKKRDPQVMFMCRQIMNDYVMIHTEANYMYDPHKVRNAIRPEYTADRHDIAVAFIQRELDDAEKPVIVMTHHAPAMEHCNDQRRGVGYDLVNYAYATDLVDLVVHPAVVAWVHGHTHDEKITYFGDVPLQTFARGYRRRDFITKDLEIATVQFDLGLEDTANDF